MTERDTPERAGAAEPAKCPHGCLRDGDVFGPDCDEACAERAGASRQCPHEAWEVDGDGERCADCHVPGITCPYCNSTLAAPPPAPETASRDLMGLKHPPVPDLRPAPETPPRPEPRKGLTGEAEARELEESLRKWGCSCSTLHPAQHDPQQYRDCAITALRWQIKEMLGPLWLERHDAALRERVTELEESFDKHVRAIHGLEAELRKADAERGEPGPLRQAGEQMAEALRYVLERIPSMTWPHVYDVQQKAIDALAAWHSGETQG